MLFGDMETRKSPSVLNSGEYKGGMYAGEAKIAKKLKNGMYELALHGGQNPSARPVFNMGESVFPNGIMVFAIVTNGEGYILGRMRTPKDEEKSDGEPELDKPTTVGNEGDATLRVQNNIDADTSAEVRVTGGNVVSVRSTGATNITLHPQGELLRIVCQRLLAFSDAYRIESGRAGGGQNSLNLDSITTQEYKNRVGPARVEVRVKNGAVSGKIVHQFSVDDLATGGGKTLGLSHFKWTVDSEGKWVVANAKQINIGDIGNEPIVLGNQLTKFLTSLLDQIITPHNTAITTIYTILTAIMSVLQAITAIPPLTAAAGLIAPVTAQVAQGQSQAATATPQIPAMKTVYLTSAGTSNPLILSDFFNTQKIAPIPGVVKE